jgi:Ca-activated chloride channel family protein
MRPIKNIITAVIWVCLLSPAVTAYAQPENHGERTGSPYFFVQSDDPELDQLPLQSTGVQVHISGVIADVLVTQVYKNEGTKPLEAIYVFPASTRAAVYGMTMHIGERTIVAKIAKREDARREYEEAKKAGKSASLLEQHRPNTFQMNVANILPGDVVTVEMRYTELLVPTDAVYEFIYPTVVGPRYTNQSAEKTADPWIGNPYLRQGESPTYTFSLAVDLSAGLPIQEISCPTHKVNVSYEGPAFSSIRLDPSEVHGGNRDFILKYRLSGDRIDTGLLLFQGKDENFFLLMAQPPRRVTADQIPPREYVFVVDVSGSMHGFPLDISKKLLKDLIGKLRPMDRFNVLLFAGGSSFMSEHSLPATPENVRHAIHLIDRQRGGGGTELLRALNKALTLPKAEGYSRTLVIATDGYVSVETEAFDLIRDNLGRANVFAFGIGSSVNRFIIEGMARAGMGEPFVVTKPGDAVEKAKQFRKLIQKPVLTGVKLDFGNFEAYDVEPPTLPDVFAERPVIVFGKWRGKREGLIELRGTSGNRLFAHSIDVAQVKPRENHSALPYLWARHRIALLSDYNRLQPQDERVSEVTNLGLTYNLLTAYTSFVAVDTQVRLLDGKPVLVKQPLPLPQGVSNLAVGNQRSVPQTLALTPSATGVKGLSLDKCCEYKQSGSETPTHEALKKTPLVLDRVRVSGDLSAARVREVLEKEMAAFNRCCMSQPHGGIAGELVFKIHLDGNGRVTQVQFKGKNRGFDDLIRCLKNALQALRFPVSPGGQPSKVTAVLALAA